MEGKTAWAGLVDRLNHKLHVGRVFDLEVQAVVPPSGLVAECRGWFSCRHPREFFRSVAGGASLGFLEGFAKNAISGSLCVSRLHGR